MATITGTVKTMQEQNMIFEKLEPNKFKRVLRMAADMRRHIDEERVEAEQKRMERYSNDERDKIWKNDRGHLQDSKGNDKQP